MTFKALIVDDEILTIQSLEKLIPQLDARFSVVGSAQNGKIAYERVRRLQPDLIILDVNMPIRSGLQLLEQLRAENSDCVIVILSAYREFEYAQAAMRNGASQYLLKPLEPEKLRLVLAETAQRLLEKRRQVCAHDTLNRSLLPDRLSQAFASDTDFLKNYAALAKLYGLPAADITLIGTYNLLHDSAEACRAHVRQLNTALGSEQVYCFAFDSTVFFLLGGSCYTPKKLYEYLARTDTAYFLFCTSKPACAPTKLAKEFQLIRHNLQSLFYYYDTKRIFLRAENTIPLTAQSDSSSLGTLHDMLERKQADSFLKHLESYMLESDRQKNLDPESIYKTIYEIIVLFKTSDLLFDESLKLELDALTYVGLHTYWNIDRLFLFIYSLSLRFFEQSAPPSDNNAITLAKAYCSKNYRQNIGLQEVADHVHMSKAYFSTYFKVNAGITFTSYLTGVRMDVAKYMLTSTNMKIGEIANSTGYPNASHFIRIFREHVKMTPQEYRNAQNRA